MLRSLLSTVNLLSNPILVKGARARLRWKHVLSWGTVVLTITAFICVIQYLSFSDRGLMSEQDAARSLLPSLIWTQFVILMGMGTGSVASGLARERLAGLLNYQRMTPMSPTAKIIGYLFGLPIREYFLFALTVPFVVFAVVKGDFPVLNILQFYGVFFTSVWVYHMTAMVAGMASSRPLYSSAISLGMVVVLYFILPRLELVGFKFFEHLTMLPAFIGLVMTELAGVEMIGGDPFWDVSRIHDVAFYDWLVHPTVFTLLVQGFLLTLMFIVVHRKWRDEYSHALSKSDAFIAFAGVLLFLVGNLWPIVSHPETFEEFITRLEMNPDHIPPSFPLFIIIYMFLFISGFFAFLLLNLITPNRHTMTKGLHLARKLGQTRVGANTDAASSLTVTLGMIVLTIVSCVALIALAHRTSRYFVELPGWWICIAPLALHAGVFLFVQALRERFSVRVFLVATFLLWAVPFFVAMILMVAKDKITEGMYVGLPCPPLSQAVATSYFFEAALNVNDYDMMTFPDRVRDEILDQLPAMTWVSVAFYLLLGGLLQLELFRWKRQMRRESLLTPVVTPATSDTIEVTELIDEGGAALNPAAACVQAPEP